MSGAQEWVCSAGGGWRVAGVRLWGLELVVVVIVGLLNQSARKIVIH